MNKSAIKQTEEFQYLFGKYGSRYDYTTFLSKWEHWYEYRRWQEREGIRKTRTLFG